MNKRTTLVAGVVAVGLLLVPGCGKVAEKATEKAIEKQTGGKVDVDKDGKVSIKTSDGELEMNGDSGSFNMKTSDGEVTYGEGAEVPEDWPSFLALPKGSKVTSASTSGGGMNVTFETGKSVDDLKSYFASELEDEGWKESSTISGDDTIMITYEKDGDNVMVNASKSTETKGGSSAMVTYSKSTTSSDSASS